MNENCAENVSRHIYLLIELKVAPTIKYDKINQMRMKTLKPSQLSSLPRQPGVYLFYGKEKSPLYIGKSSDLRERVKNHFNQPNYKDNLFINQVEKIGYIPLESEIEALILESQLIKKYQPKFNVLFRDDKNYFYVGFTKENWPRVFITHQPNLKIKNLKLNIEYIGPFVGGTALKETLKILRKIFPYRTCKTLPKKPCLWYELNRCPAPCLIEKELKEKTEFKKQLDKRKKDYQKNIKKLKIILKEGKEKLIKDLKKEMEEFAKNEEFEKAAKVRNQITALEGVFSHKIIFYPEKQMEDAGKLLKESLKLPKIPKRIEGYDISHIQGKEMVGSMVVFKLSQIYANNGTNLREYKPDKKEYRRFKIKMVKGQNDVACLKEVIKRRLSHPEWPYPDLIYVDGGKGQFNAVATALKETGNSKIPVISLAKKKKILYNLISIKPLSLDNLPQVVKITILCLRDEAHRFAIFYHKKLRSHQYIH
ncbi:MAG TPA: UvrB/UvrC motif-containing protein [Candidatus Pacearchaeota archaeon]|nr:UvrB/UvrC motif-containing protein [Candidatus Pacearchaeota archaeon]